MMSAENSVTDGCTGRELAADAGQRLTDCPAPACQRCPRLPSHQAADRGLPQRFGQPERPDVFLVGLGSELVGIDVTHLRLETDSVIVRIHRSKTATAPPHRQNRSAPAARDQSSHGPN
jgi:hypothetical protein